MPLAVTRTDFSMAFDEGHTETALIAEGGKEMTKAFRIEHKGKPVYESTRYRYAEAHTVGMQARSEMASGPEKFDFFLSGKEVSADDFIEMADKIGDEKWDKLMESHKVIYVPVGYIGATTGKYRPRVVRK
jgi:hypothetical protein